MLFDCCVRLVFVLAKNYKKNVSFTIRGCKETAEVHGCFTASCIHGIVCILIVAAIECQAIKLKDFQPKNPEGIQHFICTTKQSISFYIDLVVLLFSWMKFPMIETT